MKRFRAWMVIPVVIVVIGMLSAVGLSFAAQNRGTAVPPQSPAPYVAKPPVQSEASTESQSSAALTYSGDVQSSSTVNVVPKVSGRILKMDVDVGSQVKAGDVLAELDHAQQDLQVQQAQAALDGAQAKLNSLKAGGREEAVAQAQANLDMANAKLASMEDGPRPEVVAQAQANLKAAQAKLDQLNAGPTQAQIDAAEAAVRAAKDNLAAVEANADSLMSRMGSGYTPAMKEAQSGAAYEQVQAAQAQLDALKAPPTKEQLDQAQAAVDAATQQLSLAQHPYTDNDLAQARAAVDAAQQAVAMAKTPATKNDLDAAQSAVDQANAALELANLQVKESTIVAPISGVVTDRMMSEGSLASPGAPILALASTGTEISVGVDANRVGTLTVGQPVQVTTDAYPGVTFQGSIASIAPTVDSHSQTVAVKVDPKDPDSKLMPGMLVQVAVQASQP